VTPPIVHQQNQLSQEHQPLDSFLGDSTDALRDMVINMLQSIMERDVTAAVGAGRYQRNDDRVDVRNGSRPRRFDTRLGTLNLEIPRTRETNYMPAFIDRRERSEKALIALVQEAYINGVSTRKMKKLLEELGVNSFSKAQVSEVNKEIEEIVNAFRKRPLNGTYSYIMFDAVYEKIRVDRLVQSQAVVVAYGVRDDGNRELIGIEIFNTESYESWSTFFRGLLERGLTGVRLVMSDAHAGLVKAIETVFVGASWQRCKVHFMRNVNARVPHKHKKVFAEELKQIWQQKTRENANACAERLIEKYEKSCSQAINVLIDGLEDTLTYLDFPEEHWSKISSTNPIERLNREIRRRTRSIGVFPDIASALRLIGSILLDQTEEWGTGHCYMSPESMQLIPASLPAATG
jgi:transposase-like protein